MSLAFGPFELTRMIGRGGMAEVFLAQRRGQEHVPPVVLKRLRPEVAQDQEYARRLALEAQLASRLSHPSIVKLLEYGRVGQCHYLAMEQVKGWSLRRLVDHAMERDQAPPIGAALGIIEGIMGGLAAMHASLADDGSPRPFLHRDVTPNNVIVDHDGRAVLIDYGIAKDVFGPTITMIGKIVGTSRYMAPEHRLSQRCTPRADVFSASRICFELITGRHPWELLSAHRELLRVVFDPPEPTAEVEARIPADLRPILWRGLACDAEERFADATAMLDALRATETWKREAADPAGAVCDWVSSIGLPADETLSGPVIDSPAAGGASTAVWSAAGILGAEGHDPGGARFSNLPDAAVLSIPPLPPPRRDSWAATGRIAVRQAPSLLVVGAAAGALALLVALALW